jgi:ATP-dependent DNA ligase
MKQGSATNFSFIEPMMALRVRDLPIGKWLYELKFDGYRALAFKAGKEVRLLSRNRTIFNHDYPPTYRCPEIAACRERDHRRRDRRA